MKLFKKYTLLLIAFALFATDNLNASAHRWDQEGIPHKGWVPTHIVTRDERDGRCEFCSNKIKYEHHLTHNETGLDMIAGAKCAIDPAEKYKTTIRRRQTAAAKAVKQKKVGFPRVGR